MGIKLGLVGLGMFGSQFAKLFKSHPLVDKIALCDCEPAKIRKFLDDPFMAPKVSPRDCYETLDDLCKSDVDAVVVITQPWLHAPQCLQVINAGKHVYSATPVVNGAKASKPITVTALTRGNFASWTPEQRKNAAQCIFDESTVSFGTATAGTKVKGTFTFTNKGKSALKFYSLDADADGVTATLPGEIAPQGKGSIPVTLDTSALPKGETVVMLTLTTNCPARPIINLFLVGLVK